MKNKNLFISFSIKFIVFLVFGVLFYIGVFTKLDFRLYDSLLGRRKKPEIDKNIMLVKVDDPSIKELGEWPWSRDVYADALLRMKELGAEIAIFDIEYISPTKNGIAPSAEQKIYKQVAVTEEQVNILIDQLSSAIKAGYIKASEVPAIVDEMISENIEPTFENLQNYIADNMSRDNDEYFAQSLQFFGKAYLTINHDDLGYDVSAEEKNYIQERILKDNVKDASNLIQIGNDYTSYETGETRGFNPAMYKLMTRAYGANFTNSVVDGDGVRRRMQLLFKYNNDYINQLAFGPFLEIVDSKELIREKNYLIVKNAKNPYTGQRHDLKIPLDTYGRLLINYHHGESYFSFKNESIIYLIKLDTLEDQIMLCLNNIAGQPVYNDDGSEMEYTYLAYELIDEYDQICRMKEQLMSQCTGYALDGSVIDGITDEEYRDYFNFRNQFYTDVAAYASAGYLDDIYTRLDQLAGIIDDEIIEQYKTYLAEDFDNLKYNSDTFNEFMTEMRQAYNGAYCIIGNTATSTTDIGATPYETKFMNVAIHANVLNTLLQEDFIVTVKWQWGFLLAFILSLLMLLLIKASNAKQNIITFIAYLIYCLFWGALFVFSKYYIQFIGTILCLVVDLAAGIGYRFFLSNKEKQFITQIASSFANKDTVNELRKNPDAFKTEGQKKCITALFSDIQKFSTLSESIGKLYGDEGPNKLIEILNEYLGQMSNEILRNNGNIDKYEGDAIISMFGAPDPMNSHTPEEWAYLCLDSAIRMKKVEVEFNNTHADLFEPKEITHEDGSKEVIQLKPLQTRIGVNSGEAFVGLMGSKTDTFSKLNYTMIGDTVNLASRLEGVNKAYGSWIMCSDDTWNMADSGAHKGAITAKRLDQVRVVGRSTPVQLYSIVGFTNELSREQKEEIDIFHAALDKYLNRDFANAGKLFMQANSMCSGDPIALVFADRCKNFLENGVSEDWDGVINMTSK
ncbi:Adenylate cyclase, class 3 [Treponema bryantii]|uniref:Adenylate cyclase, class 3 n=1 Tax=Treponema bryantii TaxID=163 RepID=A0A1I3IY73_9SPIR|nr:adenylate/guanylate cyclase domain-containing protein [Treponema bryantii]SFI52891.1 Adenylate cyclase, class 3 [Treponema bryantii]